MPAVLVTRPGLQTTVQDAGRWGWQALGVSVSGAMDPHAYRLANALVNNPFGTAVLEVTLVGPRLEFEDERLVAVTGADFAVTVGDVPVPSNAAFRVERGSCLQFGARRRGARAYLAVAGGVAVPMVFGSRSTHLASRMGGFEGRALMAGDHLPLGAAPPSPVTRPVTPEPFSRDVPTAPAAVRVRVLADRHPHMFETDAMKVLESAPYVVGPSSDRMGFRLSGPVLRHDHGADIVSDVTPLGTLQVPSSGQPILLMADRPTTGGYARIGTVISADLGLAAQLAPGDSLTFEACTLREAIGARIATERMLMAAEARARP